jgi:cyclopropane fatty-acyl-phospholipid synthase-like methyltransferase
MKPFSQACENNKQSILEVLVNYFPSQTRILEIGSGTGQHAVYFAEQQSGWQWQTSDRPVNHLGIKTWIAEKQLANVLPPVNLDVSQWPWPAIDADQVFSANTCHIMAWPMVTAMLQGVAKLLPDKGYFCLYGPFKVAGCFTSANDERFDAQLRSENPVMGLRAIEDLQQLAADHGLNFIARHNMPANNFILVWQKLC